VFGIQKSDPLEYNPIRINRSRVQREKDKSLAGITTQNDRKNVMNREGQTFGPANEKAPPSEVGAACWRHTSKAIVLIEHSIRAISVIHYTIFY